MFASLFVLLYVAHLLSDYPFQTDHQAGRKAQKSLAGWRANLAHAGTHILVSAVALGIGVLVLGLGLAAPAATAALLWIGVSHSIIDRRWLVLRWMERTGQREFIQHGGAAHAARYAGDRRHFTTACAVYPAPAATRLVHDADVWPVTCPGCKTALAIVITCPLCKTPGAQEFWQPIPHTDDSADCARCVNPACGIAWGLDPGADGSCTECGGSGHTGRGTIYDPRCSCGELSS
jgi:Protein of unknown function (DUF3307)